MIPEVIEIMFWRRVDKRGPDECWLWTGDRWGKNRSYGRAWNKVDVGAHQLSYEIANGPVPEGLEIDHTCRVPLCVNPAAWKR